MGNSLTLSEQPSTLRKVASFACKISKCLDRSVVKFAITERFGMSLFHDAHVVMRSFPVGINNIANACFPETLNFYLMPESLND